MPTKIVVLTRNGESCDTRKRDGDLVRCHFDDPVDDSWAADIIPGKRKAMPSDVRTVKKVLGTARKRGHDQVRSQLGGAADDDSRCPDVDGLRRTESTFPDTDSNKKKQRRKYHQKNKEIQPSFCCAVCGRHDFETETGGLRHQSECNGQCNSKGPWKCSICGRDNFSTSQAFSGHWRCCNKGSHVTQLSLSLQPEVLRDEFAKLSDFNKLILGSMEFFEASESDVDKQVAGNGRRNIEVGNIGIRCKECVQTGVLTVGSISYTNDLKTLPHNMYVMTKRHLLGNCPNVVPTLRFELERSKKCSTSQSMTKGALGLPSYLRRLIASYELTDDGKANGVRRQTLSSIMEADYLRAVATNEVEL